MNILGLIGNEVVCYNIDINDFVDIKESTYISESSFTTKFVHNWQTFLKTNNINVEPDKLIKTDINIDYYVELKFQMSQLLLSLPKEKLSEEMTWREFIFYINIMSKNQGYHPLKVNIAKYIKTIFFGKENINFNIENLVIFENSKRMKSLEEWLSFSNSLSEKFLVKSAFKK